MCFETSQELGGTKMVWRLSLLAGPGERYSDDIPENVCR